MRLSPIDAMNYIPQSAIGLGHFLLGRHEEAVAAVRRALQLNPGFSVLYGLLATPLAKLGRARRSKSRGVLHLVVAGYGELAHVIGRMCDTGQ